MSGIETAGGREQLASRAPSAGAAAVRTDLPIEGVREQIKRHLGAARRLVITAPTGSGKSTRVPRFLLEDGLAAGRILVLEPRRLAARVLAERVANELGEAPGITVGYRTRFENCGTETTRIWYITEGILPRLLQDGEGLNGIGAVVFDEFHERSITGDVCLGVLRRVQSRRPHLAVVVMSATLDAAAVCGYLGGCPHVHTEGRLFPVELSYLPKPATPAFWEDAAAAVASCVRTQPEGDVLVFMPGLDEIRRTISACRQRLSGVDVMPLYGDLPPEVQHRIMEPGPRRRIIVATNIAETSLTVPGVRHVVDSGFCRLSRYDAGRGVSMLELSPISRDAADQRAGRAGRQAPGTCRRLWTLAEQQRKVPRTAPEVLRADLAEAVLLLASLDAGDSVQFDWLEAPAPEALRQAASELEALGILAADGTGLTALGRQVMRIPAHPRLGRLLHEAVQRGCVEDACLAAAVLSERSVLQGSARPPVRDETPSDLLALADLMRQAHAARFDAAFCDGLGVHAGAARHVWQVAAHLRRGLPTAASASCEPASAAAAFAKCVLVAFPDRLCRRRDAGTLVCELRNGRTAELARESGARHASLLVAGEIREIGGRGRPVKTLITLATAVQEDWLLELFPDAWEESDETLWDAHRRQVVRRLRLVCLGITIEDRETAPTDMEAAARILAEHLRLDGLPLKGWGQDAEAWLARVRWLAGVFPERGLPTFSDADIEAVRRAFCDGATRYRDVKDREGLPYLRQYLGRDHAAFAESMAPEALRLPCGRRMRIVYQPGLPPKGRARIQDLYGMTETPRVAGGRVPVLLDILAPNLRTVQITDDLAGFWRDIYPRVRKELSRRYPKHEWR